MTTGPRFREIAAALRERVALGDVPPSGSLGSEADLCRAYSVSRMTVRKALDLLRAEGVVDSRQGAGWFVTGTSFHQPLALGTFRHAGSAVAEAGERLERRIATFGYTPAPSAVATILDVPDGADVLRCRSVRSAAGEPLERCTEWVDGRRAETISRRQAAAPGLWATLESLGHPIAAVRQTVTAGVAGERDVTLLQATVGAPLLLVRRLALDAAGDPIALADHRYLAHRFSLEVEFHGWSGRQEQPPGLRESVA